MKKTNLINKAVKSVKAFILGKKGSHTIEVLVVMAVLIAIALLFHEQIGGFISGFISNAFSNANQALGGL